MAESESPFKIITTVITTTTAIAGVCVGAYQLNNFSKQLAADRHQRIVERSLQVAQTYLTNPYYIGAANDIRDRCLLPDGNYDYTSAKTDPLVKRRIFDVLNYFEMVAIGVRQEAFSEQIIKDDYERQINKYVRAHLKGVDGDMDGSHWKSAGQLWQESTFPNLLWLYERWNPKADPTTFRNK